MPVPNTSGEDKPHMDVPANACDAHIHIYDPRFPMPMPDRRAVDRATVADYRLLQGRIGTSRVVVVQPAAYGTDNRVTTDAIAQLGRDRARGIAVVHPDVSDEALAALDAAGIGGVRFTQFDPKTAVTSADMIEPVAARIHALGWHVQLHLRGDQIVAMADMIGRLPCTIVFDHMARLPQPEGIRHPAFAIVARLLDRGRTWVKLSGAYLDSRAGAPAYPDVHDVARAWIAHAPQRMVWGSDWPHPTERDVKPDDARLLDLLGAWAPDAGVRERILVENPARLYGF